MKCSVYAVKISICKEKSSNEMNFRVYNEECE